MLKAAWRWDMDDYKYTLKNIYVSAPYHEYDDTSGYIMAMLVYTVKRSLMLSHKFY